MAKGESKFQKLEIEAFRAGIQPRTKESLKWFRERLKSVSRVNRKELLKDSALRKVNKPLIGRMFMYFYDPKHKATLPYYDRFPLILMVDKAPGGFLGLNLHYLHPRTRAIFFDKLMEFASDKRFNDTTKLRLSMDLLKGASRLKEFQPCLKHYLTNHIRSELVEVPAPEWEVALFMPTDLFVYNKRRTVWGKSEKMIK